MWISISYKNFTFQGYGMKRFFCLMGNTCEHGTVKFYYNPFIQFKYEKLSKIPYNLSYCILLAIQLQKRISVDGIGVKNGYITQQSIFCLSLSIQNITDQKIYYNTCMKSDHPNVIFCPNKGHLKIPLNNYQTKNVSKLR